VAAEVDTGICPIGSILVFVLNIFIRLIRYDFRHGNLQGYGI
jgi:hypothetical protein